MKAASEELDNAVRENETPVQELGRRLDSCLELIDYYASTNFADSVEADRALHSSKVREHARVVIRLLS